MFLKTFLSPKSKTAKLGDKQNKKKTIRHSLDDSETNSKNKQVAPKIKKALTLDAMVQHATQDKSTPIVPKIKEENPVLEKSNTNVSEAGPLPPPQSRAPPPLAQTLSRASELARGLKNQQTSQDRGGRMRELTTNNVSPQLLHSSRSYGGHMETHNSYGSFKKSAQSRIGSMKLKRATTHSLSLRTGAEKRDQFSSNMRLNLRLNAKERASSRLVEVSHELTPKAEDLDTMPTQQILALAASYEQQKNHHKAIKVLRLAITNRKGKDPKSAELAELMKELAFFLENSSELQEALDLYSNALEIQESVYGSSNIIVAKTRNNIACVHYDMKHYTEAFTGHCFVLACLTEELQLPENDPLVGDTIYNLALVAYVLGDFDAAIEFYKQVLAIRKVQGDTRAQAEILCNMGSTYISFGDSNAALNCFEEALEIEVSFCPPDTDPTVLLADATLGVALSHDAMDNLDSAMKWYQIACQRSAIALGANDPQVADSMYNLGLLYGNQDDNEKALELFQKAFEIRERTVGTSASETVDTIINIGATLAELGKMQEALEWYNKGMPLKEQCVGPNHVELGDTLFNVAEIHRHLENWEEAHELFERVYTIYSNEYGHEHDDTLEVMRAKNDCKRKMVKSDVQILAAGSDSSDDDVDA